MQVFLIYTLYLIRRAPFILHYHSPPFTGCGNGKYLGVNPQTYTIGSDICPELVVIGHSRKYEVAVCDCLNLPYRSNQFDAAICIAVVHHLSTEERRVQALRELARIVRPGGRMLVYVWAMEQERKKVNKSGYIISIFAGFSYSPMASLWLPLLWPRSLSWSHILYSRSSPLTLKS